MSRLVVRSFLISAALVAVTVGLDGTPSEAQRRENPLFGLTSDPSTIRTQMQMALPALERGAQILHSAPDATLAVKGVEALTDSYKFLRAAQESSTLLNNNRKYPDPVVELRNDRIWKVRTRLIRCHSSFVPGNENSVALCAEEADAALRELKIILQVFP